MGYQIQYGQTIVKTHISEQNKFRLSRKNGSILIVVFCILLAIFFGSRKEVRDFLVPGNSAVTREALSNMVSDLMSGEPLFDSFEAFCLEIVDGAKIPE